MGWRGRHDTGPLADGGVAGLFATAVEAGSVTLLESHGSPGADSTVAGNVTAGDAAGACVREAVRASLEAR